MTAFGPRQSCQKPNFQALRVRFVVLKDRVLLEWWTRAQSTKLAGAHPRSDFSLGLLSDGAILD